MKFSVPDMSCGHCVAAITAAIGERLPAAQVTCDLETRTVTITGADPQAPLEDAFKAAGYAAKRLSAA